MFYPLPPYREKVSNNLSEDDGARRRCPSSSSFPCSCHHSYSSGSAAERWRSPCVVARWLRKAMERAMAIFFTSTIFFRFSRENVPLLHPERERIAEYLCVQGRNSTAQRAARDGGGDGNGNGYDSSRVR
ncbi:hypothetical protein ZHAS_00011720 [Anopheles sinensis]|uniref:Uncharacterized protein n=1 Tax=Anopheles sinensis TaxID=74873 RepID=A0A084W0X5_ANOSI|nr:hypothetical protein ZHAS_00011720 [Anopheles sinensis]